MNGSTSPSDGGPAADAGYSGHLTAFLNSLLGYFRARVELAGLEGKDAAANYFKIALLLVAALILLGFGYVFLWVGIVVVLAKFLCLYWGWWVLGIGILHLLGTFVALLTIRHFWKKPVFTDTLEELRKDQEWLKNHK